MHPDQDRLFNQWSHFHETGQWQRALEILAELLAHDPESDWLHFQMGFALYRLERFDLAEKHIKKAIELDPEDADYFQTLAYLYLSMGKAGKADDYCRKAIQLAPNDAENWFLMAHLCVHFNDPKEARVTLKRAAQIDPDSPEIARLRALIGSIAEGKEKLSPSQQISELESILTVDPEDGFAFYQIGNIHLSETKNHQAAEKAFRSALRIDPQDKDYQKGLMKALRRRDPFLRFLYLPSTAGTAVFKFYADAWDRIWPIIILLFTWKIMFFVGIALYLLFVFFFWPMAKLYEKLTLVEIHKEMGLLSIYKGPFAKIHRLSFPLRLGIFATLFMIFWAVLFLLLRERDRAEMAGGLVVTFITYILVAIVPLSFAYLFYTWIRNKRRRRKNAKLY